MTVDVYDSHNQLIVSKVGTVSLATASGSFQGLIGLGATIATGPYSVKVKTDKYLRAAVFGIQSLINGQTNQLPTTPLIVGDINGDNQVSILDYNILTGCYSDLLPPADCTGNNSQFADLNDDGHVNQVDYNLFLRELHSQLGQ